MSLRVLIVDDDRTVAKVLGNIFRGTDIQVIGTATNGIDGVTAAESTQPDVVILDLNMPGLSGLSAVAKVREAAPDAAVYPFTSFPAVHYRLLELGAEKCFSKTEIDDLVAEIERLAEEKKLREEGSNLHDA